MKGTIGEAYRAAPLPGLEVVAEAMPTDLSNVCVGMRYYNQEACLDPDVPRIAAEIGKCVTCDTCQTRLETQAFTDELTGLDNRHALKLKLERLLLEDAPILLAFTDLRKFKAVNENLDHKKGDQILVETAMKLRQIVREEDWVAEGRYGGDEMVMMMQLTHIVQEPGSEPRVVPVEPEEVPEIEAEVAGRIIKGHNNIQAYQDYNEEYGLTGRDKLGVRVGVVTIYPKELREEGRTIMLEKLMDRADPKKHYFPWNTLG